MAKTRFSPEYLKELVADPKSSVHLKKSVKEILLQPFHLRDISAAVAEILDSSLLQYDTSLDGLLLGYQNEKRLGDTAPCNVDSSQVSIKIQADFYIFQPKIGNTYRAIVHKLGVAHVGCLLYNHFNISLPILPEKLGLLKSLALQTKVTFILEEFDLTGELPFFKGQLATVSSKPAGQLNESKKSQKQKETSKLSSLNMSKTSKEVGVKEEKQKKEKRSKLALNESKTSKTVPPEGDVETESNAAKPFETLAKKKRSLSLKPIKLNEETPKGDSSDDDGSGSVITPFQRPTERTKSALHLIKEDSQEFSRLKPLVKSLRESPLKELSSCDDSSSGSLFDLLINSRNSPTKKPSENCQSNSPASQSVKKSSPKPESNSSAKKVKIPETPVKTNDDKSGKSQASTSMFQFLQGNDSSSEEESSGIQALQKTKSFVAEPLEGKISSPTKSIVFTSTQITPSLTVPPRFSQESEDSISEGSDDEKLQVSASNKPTENRREESSSDEDPLRNSLLKGSESSDEPTSAKPATSNGADNDPASRRTTNPREESSLDDGDVQPQKQSNKSSSEESDSEADVPKPPRDELLGSKLTTERQQDVQESSSDSGSNHEAPARSSWLTSLKGTLKNPDPKKNSPQVSQKKLLLNQTCLDGSVHSRSPLACSTPTAETTKLVHKNPLIRSLYKPLDSGLGNVVKPDEPGKKKESKSVKETQSKSGGVPKQSDSELKDLHVKSKKKKKKKSKTSVGKCQEDEDDSIDFEEQCRLMLERINNDDTVCTTSSTKKRKKDKSSEKRSTQLIPDATSARSSKVPQPSRSGNDAAKTVPEKKSSKIEKELKVATLVNSNKNNNLKDGSAEKKKSKKRKFEEAEQVNSKVEKEQKIAISSNVGPKDDKKKSKKRKFEESEDRKDTVPSDRDSKDHKKRKLFTPKIEDTFSSRNISLAIETSLPKTVVSTSEVLTKPTDSNVKLDSSSLREADFKKEVKKKRKSILFGATQTSSSKEITQAGSNKEESVGSQTKHDKSTNELLSIIKNAVTNMGIDKPKKKNKKDVSSSVEISTPAPDAVINREKAKNAIERITAAKKDKKVSLPTAATQETVVKDQSIQIVDVHSKKKSKRKEKEGHSSVSGQTSDIRLPLPVGSVLAEKKTISEAKSSAKTGDSTSKERKKAKKKKRESRKQDNKSAADSDDDMEITNLMKRLIEKAKREINLAGTNVAAKKIEKKSKSKNKPLK